MQCEPTSTVIPVRAESGPEGSGQLDSPSSRALKFELDTFAYMALEQEAARLAVSVEELARFAVLYYLADRDSGRIARQPPQLPQPPQPPSPDQPHPLDNLLDG